VTREDVTWLQEMLRAIRRLEEREGQLRASEEEVRRERAKVRGEIEKTRSQMERAIDDLLAPAPFQGGHAAHGDDSDTDA
jgi:chromosome segregation ATPase